MVAEKNKIYKETPVHDIDILTNQLKNMEIGNDDYLENYISLPSVPDHVIEEIAEESIDKIHE